MLSSPCFGLALVCVFVNFSIQFLLSIFLSFYHAAFVVAVASFCFCLSFQKFDKLLKKKNALHDDVMGSVGV